MISITAVCTAPAKIIFGPAEEGASHPFLLRQQNVEASTVPWLMKNLRRDMATILSFTQKDISLTAPADKFNRETLTIMIKALKGLVEAQRQQANFKKWLIEKLQQDQDERAREVTERIFGSGVAKFAQSVAQAEAVLRMVKAATGIGFDSSGDLTN